MSTDNDLAHAFYDGDPDDMADGGGTQVGKDVHVEAVIDLGSLSADDIQVQLYCGPLDEDGQLSDGQAKPMEQVGQGENQRVHYSVHVPCTRSGKSGYTVRILPSHAMLPDAREMAMIRWA